LGAAAAIRACRKIGRALLHLLLLKELGDFHLQQLGLLLLLLLSLIVLGELAEAHAQPLEPRGEAGHQTGLKSFS
jgi:hypothetical protein